MMQPTMCGIAENDCHQQRTHEYYECAREEMLDFVPQRARTVLDIGCGAGRFGSLLKQRQPVEIWGVEPDTNAARQASTRLDHVLVGDFPSGVRLPERYFDCIQFNDVLEHMVDPWHALRVAQGCLSDQGVVVASIPNVRFLPILYRLLVRGEWTYTPSGILDKTHLRFFTRSTILKMFEETEYQVVRMRGMFPDGHWQTKILLGVAPWIVKDARYMEYAVVARPASQLGALSEESTAGQSGMLLQSEGF